MLILSTLVDVHQTVGLYVNVRHLLLPLGARLLSMIGQLAITSGEACERSMIGLGNALEELSNSV